MSKKELLERIEDLEADRDNLAQRIIALERRRYVFPPPARPRTPQPWTPWTIEHGYT